MAVTAADPTTVVNVTIPKSRSPWMQVTARLMRNPPAMLGVTVIASVLLVALFADALAPYRYDAINLNAVEQAPSPAHWLGTDLIGHDMLSRIIWGARSAVFVVVMVTLVDLALGIPLGALAGYFGGWVDTLIMRVVEIMFAFPGLLFVFFIAATIRPAVTDWVKSVGIRDPSVNAYISYAVVIIALGIVGWAGLARLVRGQVLAVKNRDYVISAFSVGVPTWKVIFRHILPNALAPVIVAISMGMGFIALSEGYLSYLGIGLQPPAASWGGILADNAGLYWRKLPHMIWLVMIPSAVLTAVVLAFSFLGDGLNEALNPEINE